MKLQAFSALLVIQFAAVAHAEAPNYEDQIKPLLRSHCLQCHNSDDAEADLDLSTYAAVMNGGSSGPVVKAGRPESSPLYRAIIHADDVAAMPPESPKLPEAKLALVREWIRGGLLDGKGGKSQLRNVAAMRALALPAASAPLPTSLPPVAFAETVRPPIPQAMAVSPGAPLLAVSGEAQILLYSPQNARKRDVQPTASGAIVRRWSFDDKDGTVAGKMGQAARFQANSTPLRVEPLVDFSQFTELTLSLWIRPRDGSNNPMVFGQQNGLHIFLERQKEDWRPRIFLRDQDNQISYYGRVGKLPLNEWSHLAASWDGAAWDLYVDGQHVAQQPCPSGLKRIQQRPDAMQSIGRMVNHGGEQSPGFVGEVDELRIYNRALDRDEVRSVMREAAQSESYAALNALPFPEGTIHDIKFSRNGALLLAAGGRGAHSGRVVLFDVKTGERVAEIGDEVDSVLAADVSSDHQYVALGGPAKLIKVLRTDTGQLVHRIKKHTDWITAVEFSPDGKMIATGDRSGGIHVWETQKGAIVFTLDEHKVRITDLAWRADGKLLASAAEDGNLILWSMQDGFPVRNVSAHVSRESPRYSRRTGVVAVDFANDGSLLTTGRDRTARVWTAAGERQSEFFMDAGTPVSAAFLNDDNAVVVGDFDGSLQIFDLASKSRTQRLSTATPNEKAE